MNQGYLFSVRSGRLIADGRALFAVFLLISEHYGAGETGRPVLALLGCYLAYSLILVAGYRTRILAYGLLRSHPLQTAIDLGVFTALIYMTSGAKSPFFSPLVFLILSGTIQWGSRGALLMGGLALAVYLPAALDAAIGEYYDSSAVQTTIVRFGYTLVVTALLTSFGRHLERVVEELSRLSDPVGEFSDRELPMRELLRHALNIFGADQGVIVWNDGDEPYSRALHHRAKKRPSTPSWDASPPTTSLEGRPISSWIARPFLYGIRGPWPG